jgi:hypothetical protein
VFGFATNDGTGVLVPTDPDAIVMKIYDSGGVLKSTLAKSDLTKMATGQFRMNYNVPSPAAVGLWTILVQANITVGGVQNTERFSFSVIA